MTEKARAGFGFYQVRPVRVEAAQWFPPDNWRNSLGVDTLGVFTIAADHGTLSVGGHGEYVRPGDWIVRRSHGATERWNDTAFHETFEEAGL